MCKTLLELNRGECAIILAVEGGRMVNARLEGMGVRPGKTLSRISSRFPAGGPVIISIDGRQIAMGRGIAAKIKVSPPENSQPATT